MLPQDISHNSAKEESDFIYLYNQIDLGSLKKTPLMGVDFDQVNMDQAVAKILHMIEKKESHHHVLFLDPPKLMKMREGKKLHRITKKASLVLAEGAGLSWASQGEIRDRIPVIGLMMDLIRVAEIKGITLFFLGGVDSVIEKVFFNLSRHFPKIRIVGRHAGHMSRQRELMVKEAIRKTSPDVIFIAMDFPDQEVWIENNSGYFGKAVIIGIGGAFDVLSGQAKKAPDWFQLNGLSWLWRVIIKPYRLTRILNLFHFFLYGLWSRFRNPKPE
jgi:N-acetylglucosaminyldiphosphoundecaprenol N-acetyl-beta-D-mannosaminyltransferase